MKFQAYFWTFSAQFLLIKTSSKLLFRTNGMRLRYSVRIQRSVKYCMSLLFISKLSSCALQ